MNLSTIENFTRKLNNDAAMLKIPTKMIVDPGKFGRIKGTDAQKYAVCHVLNPIFAARGVVTVLEVAQAFEAAGF